MLLLARAAAAAGRCGMCTVPPAARRALSTAPGAGAPNTPEGGGSGRSGAQQQDAHAAPRTGPGPATRSVDQAHIPGVWPPRSPEAPADPADKAGNRGSDPAETIRTAAWRAPETMSSHYDNPEQDKGKSYAKVIPEMAEGLVNKVKDVASDLGAIGKKETPETKAAYYEAAARKLRRNVEDVEEEEPPQQQGGRSSGGRQG